MKRHLFHFLLAAFASLTSLHAQFDPFAGEDEGNPKSSSSFISSQSAIAPGKPFIVAVKLDIPEKWHAYYINPGAIGSPIKIEWDLPEGFKASDVQWQVPHIGEMLGQKTYGYSHTSYFPVTITPPAELPLGKELVLKMKANWQICDEDNCVYEPGPGNLQMKEFSLTVTTAAEPSSNTEAADDLHEIEKYSPKPTDDWALSASDNGETIRIQFTPPSGVILDLGKIYFFDRDRQVDPQAEQKVIQDGDSYVLTAPRFLGSDFVPDPTPRMDNIGGVLSINNGEQSLKVDTLLKKTDVAGETLAPVTLSGETEKKLNIWSAIGFAFLGGMILNLMPCVFPVLGIKIMGFVQQAGEDPKKIKIHGLVFAAGLLISLWLLAGVLIALITVGGKTLGWGFQLNNPIFLSGMIVLLFVLALNLTGVFEMGTSLTGVGGELQSKKGYKGSFFSGVLTTLIATPCTGPFLGTTMGYTLQQPPVIAFIVFTSLGLGIASPYILLSFFPSLIKKLPRPGAWMETFKQIMAFPLYATVIFFLHGFGNLTGNSGLTWMLTALLILTIALWIYGRWYTPLKSKRARVFSVVFTLLFLSLAFVTAKYALKQTPPASDSSAHANELFAWKKWKPGIVHELQEKGHIVFLDYTSDT